MQYLRSDANGFLEWKNAPNKPVTFSFLSQDCYPTPERTLSPGETVHEIRLNKKLNVTLNATDTDGNPIPSFRVLRGTKKRNYANWDPDSSFSGRKGWATFSDPMTVYYPSDQEWPSYVFRVEAEGYSSVVTRPVSITEEELALAVKLVPSEILRRTLVDVSGKPLADRTLWLLDPGTYYSVSIASLSLNQGNDQGNAEEITTDEKGEFTVPNRPRVHSILGLFEEGFLHHPLTDTLTYRLTTWSTLSGTWREDGRAMKGVKMGFNAKHQSSEGTTPFVTHFVDTTTTDSKGQFYFARVPAMNIRVCRIIELERTTNYQWFNTIDLHPGAEKIVTLNQPKLRSLQGVVEIPEAIKSRTAPGYVIGTLEPDMPGIRALLQTKSETLNEEEYRLWYFDWIQTDEGKAHMAARERSPHYISVNGRGIIAARSIFPGEYLLSFSYEGTKLDHRRKHPRTILAEATLRLEITPDSPDIIDLGRITLKEFVPNTK